MGNASSVSAEGQGDLNLSCTSTERMHNGDDTRHSISPTCMHRTNVEAREQLRTHLFRCSADELGSYPEHAHYSPTFHASRSSLQPKSHAVPNSPQSPTKGNIEGMIPILQEIKKQASPEQIMALQAALGPSSPDTAIQKAASPTSGKKRHSKLDALSRRKSFFTPGIATRDQANIEQQVSPTSPQPRAQTWNTDMFGQSPLSKLAGWESKNNGQSERAVTPDIRHLGIHELGSLRVTNGAASPAPSMHSALVKQPSLPKFRPDDDYYTASEGGRDSPDKMSARSAQSPEPITIAPSPTTPTQTHLAIPDAWEKISELQYSHSDESIGTDSRPSTQASSDGTEDSLSIFDTSLNRAATVLRPYHNYHNEASSNPFLTDSIDPQASVSFLDLSQPEKSPVAMYQTEANSNPFLSFNNGLDLASMDPSYPSRSMPNTLQQALSDRDIAYQETSATTEFQRTASRANAYDRLNGYPDRDGYSTAASSIYTAGSRREKREVTERPKTDSGYHSESSLRTLNTHSDKAEITTNTLLNDPRVMEVDVSAATTFGNQWSNQSNDKRRPTSTPYSVGTVETSKTLPRDPARYREGKTKSTSNLLTLLQTSPVKPSSPGNQVTPLAKVQSGPTESPSNNAKQSRSSAKKLQKKNRPLSARLNSEPVIVQSQKQVQENLSNLPQVPIEISSRFSKRMSENPDMEHLERTFKSVDNSASRDSVSSMPPFNFQNLRFPSPTRSPNRGPDDGTGRKGHRSSSGFDRPMRNIFRSRSKTMDDTKNGGKEWLPIGDADFGTVTASLGSSPYDLATSTAEREPRRSTSGQRGATHPHQMSSNLPRSKSAIGMSDQAASAYARNKSRDRLEDINAIFQRGRTTDSGRQTRDRVQAERSTAPQINDSYDFQCYDDPSRQSTVRRKPIRDPRTAGMRKSGFDTTDNHQSLSDQRHSAPLQLTLSQTNSDDSDSSWEEYARAWRMRRKSIGENLSQRTKDSENAGDETRTSGRKMRRPPTPHSQSAPQTPATVRQSRMTQPHQQSPQKRERRQKEVATEHGDLRADNRVRTASPTPSVRERAAAFERGVDVEPTFGLRSPTRRTPSPLKSATLNNSASSEPSPPRSKFSLHDASPSVAPSGVASAYTAHQPMSPSKSRGQQTLEPPFSLAAPKRRAWPTSAFAADPRS